MVKRVILFVRLPSLHPCVHTYTSLWIFPLSVFFYAVQHQFDIAGINKLAQLCKPTFLLIILHLFFLTLILIILHLIILHLLLIILHLLPNATDDHPPQLGSRDPEKSHFDPIATFELVRIEKCIFPECKMCFCHSANCIQTTHDQGPRMSRRKAAPPQYRLFTLNSPPSTPIRPNQTRGGGRCCDSDGSICLRCRIVTLLQQRSPFSRLCWIQKL